MQLTLFILEPLIINKLNQRMITVKDRLILAIENYMFAQMANQRF